MFTRKILITFAVSVGFWAAASWYYIWYCGLSGRSQMAKTGLQFAGVLAILGAYALLGGPTLGTKNPPQKLDPKDAAGARQIGLAILAAAAVCALFSWFLRLQR